jgi:hypothetical protein
MPLDLARLHQKIMQYPTTYLLPQEEEALQIMDGLFGEPISVLSHTARIHLVQAVVQACINVSQEE